jgi:hypothetical protein
MSVQLIQSRQLMTVVFISVFIMCLSGCSNTVKVDAEEYQRLQKVEKRANQDPYEVTREERLFHGCLDRVEGLVSENKRSVTIDGSTRAIGTCVGTAKQLR